MAEADPGAGAGTRGASEAGGDPAPGTFARPGAGPVTTRRRCAPRPRWMVGSVDVGSWSGVVGHIEFEFGERSCQWRFGDIAVGLRMVGVRGVDRGVEPSVGVIASAVAYSGDVEQLVDCRYEYDDG